MQEKTIDVYNLSSSQQVALWVIFHFKEESFFSSEVAQSKIFTDHGKKAIGGILCSLYRNGFIEKVSGGRNKLWRLNAEIEKKKNYYLKELFKVKTYWRQ